MKNGAYGIRTRDLLNAIQTRSQLRYCPLQNIIISYGFEKCKQFFTELFLSHMLGVNLDFERSSHAK